MGRDRKKQTESKRHHRNHRSKRNKNSHHHRTVEQNNSRNNLNNNNNDREGGSPVSDQQSMNKVTNIPSDAPTALIAPADYQHIYTRKKDCKPKSLEADAPTVLIAPSDYEHVYHRPKYSATANTGTTTTTAHTVSSTGVNAVLQQANELGQRLAQGGGNEVKNIPSDAPTALIAPDDYIHIYNAHKNTNTAGVTAAATELANEPTGNGRQPSLQRARANKPQLESENGELFSLNMNVSDRTEYEDIVRCFQRPSISSQTRIVQKYAGRGAKDSVKHVDVDKVGIPNSLIEAIKNFLSKLNRTRKN